MKKITARHRLIAGLGTTAAAAMLLAACGSSSSSTSSSSTTKVSGGTAYFAEAAGANPNYIFPLTGGPYFSVDNLAQFQILMYRPLYFFGVGSTPEINYQLSIGNAPVYSNNDTTVTITLKHYMWSDGEPVTSRDVIFWMNLLKANKANWAAYVPGAFPDNVASYSAPNASTVVFHLTGKVNPTWFTYNELSQITPLPIAWDRTSLSQPAPSPSAANLPDTTTSGAKAVYTFLNSQATNANAWASSPIWSVVDGPWKLKSSSTTGRMVFVPNPSYTGPVKPSLSEFVELPFTSDTAEFNTLRAGNGAITYGYVPTVDLSQVPYLKSIGYRIEPWIDFGFNYFVENFNNPTYGPLFKQTYFRQAFQHLVDQPQWISTFLKGYGVPSYSPVPLAPANPFADATSKTNPFPYSISAAKSLLTSHGWKMVNGVMTCESPGTAATDCGAGIAKGFTLTLNLQYASGTTFITQEMDALQSAAASAGIKINLSQAPFNTVIHNATQCSGSSCTWQMENWGGGWEYSPDNYPTGGEIFGTGAGSNFGNWNDPTTNSLIAETHTSSNAQAALDAYQDYMAKVLPVVYQPAADYAISAISNKLQGVTQNPYLNLTPETWYFVK
ncbi:extracellular solute-binding protein family 5 [Acidimicrobium ferrooxidans DSM 10331]|uniref:Extracellular solute-binding protein family 5 n=1 Tax=Acidimicrobium ferrooxidans (strain DSM 10331 / JCM 15462 / NBRC 103882 / ICP) TaxID=525909 RepID=C7LZB6_ACIFD|nr:ABC transporter substrate-binding protein [Acidimicrobium ferrooxidans]ACU54074.1 extracellular solute-binding protein family 5 [Acidimicrobium ferrooxidans DSM 10331]